MPMFMALALASGPMALASKVQALASKAALAIFWHHLQNARQIIKLIIVIITN